MPGLTSGKGEMEIAALAAGSLHPEGYMEECGFTEGFERLQQAMARLAEAQVRMEVRARLRELGIPLLFSYGRFA